MTVEEPRTIDMMAEGPDGRLLLVVVEPRRYARGDEAEMAEQLRQKLNAYVVAIRSGALRREVGRRARRGVDIELSCRDEPPERVRRLIDLARQGLERDGVGVGYRVVEAPADEVPEEEPSERDLVAVLGRLLRSLAPAASTRVELEATLVGDGMDGSLTAVQGDGGRVPIGPDDDLIGVLQALKRTAWTPQAGTWLSIVATAVPEGTHYTTAADEPRAGAGGFTRADWGTELQRYPRPVVPAWWQARLP